MPLHVGWQQSADRRMPRLQLRRLDDLSREGLAISFRGRSAKSAVQWVGASLVEIDVLGADGFHYLHEKHEREAAPRNLALD